ncbi:uncharacterized protein LOC135928689 [Gordionus sp. m RMFG-2023]|uniref:uncharacterized protein LOC135928689 n=1 Tax=Gordionus sp. m RMFG-2023 TaxID=3053472 RepID=UPI0031FC6A54
MSSILELVTVNGRPLSIIEDSGFQRIINPLLAGLNLVINKENLSRTINKTAQSIRDKISREVEGKLISLKVDAVQRLDRSILGVNIQFISKSIINLRTLGIVELKERCTEEYIKENIFKTLLKFKINIQQIYTITSDNGCNFLRAIKLLQSETDYDIRSESADEENMDVNVYKYDIDDIQNTFLSTIISYPIYSVRCAAHTLQLALQDAIKLSPIVETIAKARSLNLKLRHPTYQKLLKNMKLPKPVLDCHRWHSTHDMLERLILLKPNIEDFFTEQSDYLLTEDWKEIITIVEILKPLKIVTKQFQSEQLTLTDFYAAWLRCCIELEKNPNHFAQLLYSCLKNREERFIKNEILLAAIYLDPRYKVLLSDDDKICAKKHLVNLWRRIKSLTTPILSDDISSDEVIEQEDDLEKLIQLKERQEKIFKRGPTIAEKSIGTIITRFSDYKRLDKKENILHFWESAKLEHPELYILSKILFAVPATQVSVERSFSHLKFILSPHRSRMSEQLLEDIMLIRLNKIFKIDT